MSSSLALLLLLQGFWLFNSYEKAFHDFRKDVDGLFRNTVMAMRDSAMLKFIERLPPDTALQTRSTFVYTQGIDSQRQKIHSEWRMKEGTTSQVNVFISSTPGGDSLKDLLKPLVGRVQDGKMKDGNFVIRIAPDSLQLDSVATHFIKALAAAGKKLPFTIKKEGQQKELDHIPRLKHMIRMRQADVATVSNSILSDTLKSEWVRTDPLSRYSVVFTGMHTIILKEITPQILFSTFLTLLTTAAFLVMYRSIKSQQRLMEIKNDFISNITHELKTPVTTVSVALEALKSFKGLENPQRTEEYLNIAQSELNRLTILTDKILKTAIFENKGVDFESEPVDLYKTMEQVLHSMKLVFEKQKAQVTFEKTGNSFTIAGGSVHLTNVIYNLLDNALKYSDRQPHISITMEENENRVVLKIADQGIGIPREYSKKIFEKFFRVPAGDVHNVKGYGLGLSYVQSVVKSHNGKIEVSSEQGKGSTFIIFLPKNPDSSLALS